MQATVRSFDPTTRSGTVLLDDGVELSYDAPAFDRAGIRFLRIGQRVRIKTADGPDGPTVSFLTIHTLPDPR